MIKNFSSGELSAFQAYTRLTVTAHVKAQKDGTGISNYGNKISFKDFLKSIEQKEVVNPHLSREIDQWQKEHSNLQRRMTGNHHMESTTMKYIEKAYELGLVDTTGSLYRAQG